MKYLRPIIAIIGFVALAICTIFAGIVWLCLRALTGEAPDIYPIIRSAGPTADAAEIEAGLDEIALQTAIRDQSNHRDRRRNVPLTHRTTIDGRSVLGRSISMDDIAEAGESF